MEIIRLSNLSLMLLFLIVNIYIELVTCYPLLEIPFIKKTLQEYRKKMWHDYHHKLLVQCMGGHAISRSKNILSVTEILEHLYQCLVTQHEEIYKAPQRIKKFKIYDLKAEFSETGTLHANRTLDVK